MGRGEALRRVGVPLARGEGTETAESRQTESKVVTARPKLVRRKSSVSIALIDPKPLTRRSIADMLAEALLARHCRVEDAPGERPPFVES